MKITYRIPSKEPYGYVEFETESGESAAEKMQAIEELEGLMSYQKGGEGMSDVELDIWVQNMLLGKGNDVNVYEKATPSQQKELHRIKRALNRIKRNPNEEEIEHE